MLDNVHKIYLSIIIFLVILFAGFLAYQQSKFKKQNNLPPVTKGVNPPNDAINGKSGNLPMPGDLVSIPAPGTSLTKTATNTEKIAVNNPFQEMKDGILKRKKIFGKIKTANEDSWIIDAEIYDISKLGDIKGVVTYEVIPVMKKEFHIILDKNTVFRGKEKNKFESGDTVIIITDQEIYATDNVTALKVGYIKIVPKGMNPLELEVVP